MIYHVSSDGAIFPSNIDFVIYSIIARSRGLYDAQELKSKTIKELQAIYFGVWKYNEASRFCFSKDEAEQASNYVIKTGYFPNINSEGKKMEFFRVDSDGCAVAPIDGRDAVVIDAGLRNLPRAEMNALYECKTAASFCDAVNRYMDYGGNRYFSDSRAAEYYRTAREYWAQYH